MRTYQTKAQLGEDGKLRLEVPCRLPPGPVEVLVVVVPIANPPSLLDLSGLGKEIWEGVDAQEYVNRLRGPYPEE